MAEDENWTVVQGKKGSKDLKKGQTIAEKDDASQGRSAPAGPPKVQYKSNWNRRGGRTQRGEGRNKPNGSVDNNGKSFPQAALVPIKSSNDSRGNQKDVDDSWRQQTQSDKALTAGFGNAAPFKSNFQQQGFSGTRYNPRWTSNRRNAHGNFQKPNNRKQEAHQSQKPDLASHEASENKPKSMERPGPGDNEKTSAAGTDPMSSSQASTSAPKARKKRPKRPSMQERKRIREQKFYQALYGKKDTHVQFVSADVIKALQQRGNAKPQDKQKPSVEYEDPPLTSSSAATSSKEPQVLKWPRTNSCVRVNSIQSEGDFPSLVPSRTESHRPLVGATIVSYGTIQEEYDSDLRNENASKTSEEVPGPTKANVNASPRGFTQDITASSTLLHSSTTPAQKGKKSKQPLVIDVTSLIVSNKKEPKKSTIRDSGKLVRNKENFKLTAGNPLDSSGPGIIHRGKIRLQKKKKPTKLKLTILKSRALHKSLMEEKTRQESETSVKLEKPDTKVLGESLSQNVANSGDEAIKNPDSDSLKAEVPADEENRNVDSQKDVKDVNEIKKELEKSANEKFLQLLDEISVIKVEGDNVSSELEDAVKLSMHNRKFRDYCDMYTSKELYHLVSKLLSELHKFQDRLYHTDPIKFKTKRRYVSGLKEAMSYLNLNKVQLLIIAPDIEKNPEPGGLDERISQIIAAAKDRQVPYVFSGSKYNLGKPMKIKTPISIISVLDKQNCEETFKALLEETSRLREKYDNDFLLRMKEISNKVKTSDYDEVKIQIENEEVTTTE